MITSEALALLKEVSLLIKYLGHLLTGENNTTSASRVPRSIEAACDLDQNLINKISSLIWVVLSLMEAQVSKIAICPSNPRLSPSLARQFLCFLKQWVPAYVCSAADDKAGNISLFWSGKEVSQ